MATVSEQPATWGLTVSQAVGVPAAQRPGPVRGWLIAVAALASSVIVALAVATPIASAAEGCTNEAIRGEQGAAALSLAECRAYELVTPPSSHPTVPGGTGPTEAEASSMGGAIEFHSWYGISGSSSVSHVYLATRGANDWQARGLFPPLGPPKVGVCLGGNMFFSPDLSSQVFGVDPTKCGAPEPPLVAGEPRESENLFVHLGDTSGYQLVDTPPDRVVPANAVFEGASTDLSHVVFLEAAQLTPGAPPGNDLYEWNGGALHFVTYLPDGTPVVGVMVDGVAGNGLLEGFGEAANSPVMVAHEVSSDGERVVFGFDGSLYVRENAAKEQSALVAGSTKVNGEQCSEPSMACTVQLDASRGSGASGGGEFWKASADGSRIFFTDKSLLTPDSTAGTSAKQDLYEYDLETGELTDLTVNAEEPANVLGVAAVSDDGSYVYFVAEGPLSGQPNGEGVTARKFKPNLYVRHDGTTTFIATLSPEDSSTWEGLEISPTTISSGGELIAFDSVVSLTGYDQTPAEASDCEGGCREIFEYDAATNRLSCVSCGRPGTTPTGAAELYFTEGTYLRRALAPDGRVFFDAGSPLLAQDIDGVDNVYEWAPVGVGACVESSVTFNPESGGCVYPISSGTSPEPSYFVDASEDARDVFFITGQALVGSDTDEEPSLYDARVDGGFPAGSGEAVEGQTCESAEACKPPPGEPPVEPFAASGALSAGGNLQATPEQVLQSPPGKPAVKSLTRAQRLARALRACAKAPRRKRPSCEARARKKFGAKANAKAKKSDKGGER